MHKACACFFGCDCTQIASLIEARDYRASKLGDLTFHITGSKCHKYSLQNPIYRIVGA